MDPWNIIICTDIQTPFVVLVPEPSKWTLANLKQETCKQLFIEDTSFYCNEQLVPQGKPLTECPGMRNGVALLVTLKPLTVNVYCPHNDSTLHIEIPQRERNKWSVDHLRNAICYKLGIEVNQASSDILAMSGNPLTNIFTITDNCLLTYTRIKHLEIPSPVTARQLVNVPLNTTDQFASRRDIYNREIYSGLIVLNPSTSGTSWASFSLWTITIQQLNGSKNDIRLQNSSEMPIFKLRETIKDALSVDTYQQKLTIRDVVLEDWDETGAAMLITHYPLFHDGVTVYLVQLVDGIQVNVHLPPTNNQSDTGFFNMFNPQPGFIPLSLHPAGSNVSTLRIALPTYINIHVPSKVQLKTLSNIMTRLACWSSDINPKIYLWTSGQSISPSDCDKPVSSVEWITNNVTLSLTQPIVISNITNYTTNSYTPNSRIFPGQSHAGLHVYNMN